MAVVLSDYLPKGPDTYTVVCTWAQGVQGGSHRYYGACVLTMQVLGPIGIRNHRIHMLLQSSHAWQSISTIGIALTGCRRRSRIFQDFLRIRWSAFLCGPFWGAKLKRVACSEWSLAEPPAKKDRLLTTKRPKLKNPRPYP